MVRRSRVVSFITLPCSSQCGDPSMQAGRGAVPMAGQSMQAHGRCALGRLGGRVTLAYLLAALAGLLTGPVVEGWPAVLPATLGTVVLAAVAVPALSRSPDDDGPPGRAW